MPTRSTIRILIIDDNLLLLAATKMMLGSCKDFTVVGEASTALTGIKMALTLQPDVVLMDINMKPIDGIEATRKLLSQCPAIVVIGFSALPYPQQEQEMIDAGAKAVVCKSANKQVICNTIISYYRHHITDDDSRRMEN